MYRKPTLIDMGWVTGNKMEAILFCLFPSDMAGAKRYQRFFPRESICFVPEID
jgi:hypothetical protein